MKTFVYFALNLLHFSNALKFPHNFHFGASSAAYQIEGAWNIDGKGENIWDRFTHSNPSAVANGDNGDVACDSYHLYRKDVKLLKDIGFNVYRFSISWSRILPNGLSSEINPAGIAYYDKLINKLLENGIEPMVTMYHWDLPQKLQDMGGWTNASIIEWFENYADILFLHFGDRVKWWLTINEPDKIVYGYCGTKLAPALNLTTPYDYIIVHNILRAHARVYRLYGRKYRSKQNGKVSISISKNYCTPKTRNAKDEEAVIIFSEFTAGIFANPIYSEEGGYPKIVRQMVDARSRQEGRNESRLPYLTKKEKLELKGASDFFSLNHYTSYVCSTWYPDSTNNFTPVFSSDMNIAVEADPDRPSSLTGWLKVAPCGFRQTLISIRKYYDNPPIYVTENGYCDSGDLKDTNRVSYHRDYLLELLKAIYINDCKVIGYTVWSLLDNFQWTEGYSSKFGLVSVDFSNPNRTRTPKSSAYFFQNIIKNRELP